MHWGSASLGGDGAFGVNALTTPARCATSQQPELKHAAVRVMRAELPWRLAAFGHAADGEALALRDALRPLLAVLPFASVSLVGRHPPGGPLPRPAPPPSPCSPAPGRACSSAPLLPRRSTTHSWRGSTARLCSTATMSRVTTMRSA